MHFGTRMKTSVFVVKRSKVKVSKWRYTALNAVHLVLIYSYYHWTRKGGSQKTTLVVLVLVVGIRSPGSKNP